MVDSVASGNFVRQVVASRVVTQAINGGDISAARGPGKSVVSPADTWAAQHSQRAIETGKGGIGGV